MDPRAAARRKDEKLGVIRAGTARALGRKLQHSLFARGHNAMTKTKAQFVLAAFTAALLATSAPVNAKQVEFDQASIPELEAAMAAGTLTSEKLVQLCLDRIKAFDREIGRAHV